MARQYKFTTAVNKVRKNNNDTGISNFDEAVESIRANRQSSNYLTEIDRENRHKAFEESQRQARQRAIELARTSSSNANAGDNRTTAYNRPQTMSVYGGLGTMPNPKTQGMNTAANGADIDYTTVNQSANKGWKGLSALNGSKASKETVSQEESLAHATEVMKPYENNTKAMEILRRYSDLEDSQDRSGMLNFQSIGAYSGNFDKLANQFIEETGVSMDEFRKIAENYSYLRHNEQREEAKAKKKEQNAAVNIAQGIGEAAISPVTNYQAMIGAMQNPNDPELGRDYNSPFMKHLNAQEDTKEAFQAKTENLSPVAKTLANLGYDLAVTGTQSAAAALTGEVGLGSFAAGGYASNLEESDERGLTEGQAQVYSAVSGGLEYITERLPIEHLKKIYNGSAIGKSAAGSLKPYIKAALEQMGEEASEELVNGIADTVADGLINGDKSKVNATIQNNINNGMSEDEATRSAYIGLVKDTGYSMLVAALSTGVSAGPSLATQAIETTRAGRNIADYENKTGNLTRNVENEVYIPTEREYYTADEDYEQAQDARQTILNASEKVAKGERISGKEARAVYEKATRALESLNARRNVEAVKAEEGVTNTSAEKEQVEYKAPEKTNEQIIEDIEFASTPYQLAQAIDQVTEETDEIKELIEYKRQELEMYNFKSSDVDNAVTEKKALEMGQRGEEVTKEQLNAIPQADRQKVLEANNQAYNRAILAEHKNAVVDTKTGKYFVPSEVKIQGADVVIVDSEGNAHTDYSNPRITQALSVATQTSRDARGHLTSQSMYKSTPTQAAYAIGLALKSPEASSALIRTAVEAIYNSASVGHTTFEEFEKNSKGLFTKIDKTEARFLYNNITEEARKSDARKTENTKGKKTSEKAVSDTLKEALPEETTALLEALSNKIGYNFVASTNKNARGSINPGTRQISIGTNSIDEVWSIVAHEAIGEYLQAHGKEEDVLAIQDDMFKYLEGKLGSDAFNDLINQYQSVYRTGAKEGTVDYGKSRRAAANEMFNDTIFALLSSEEGVKDYVSWLSEGHEKSFFEKVKDFFNKIVESIRNYIDTGSFNAAERAALEMDYDQAKAMRDRIFKAMDEAIKSASETEAETSNRNSKRNSFGGLIARTSDMKTLTVARDMQSEGKSMKEIFAKTGWYQGADGRWKFEISNRNADIYVNGAAKLADTEGYKKYLEDIDYINTSEVDEKWMKAYQDSFDYNKEHNLNKSEYRLDEILKNDELFEAYPSLARIKVKFEKLASGTNGVYNHALNEIILDKDLKAYKGEIKRAKRTLFHELQHAIQAIEGFANGSSPTYWENIGLPRYYDEEEQQKYNAAVDELENIEKEAPEDFLERYHNYKNLLARYGGRTENEDLYSMAQDIEAELREENEELFDKLDDASFNVDVLSPEQKELTANEAYYATAGEIEARDVSDRLNLSEEEAKNTLPKTTDDEGRVVFVENPLFPWSYPDTRFSKKVDEAYDIAVEENNTELMEKLVETAAVNAGFDSTKLYHGTDHFGFTSFDKEKLDDKNSIFVAEDLKVSSSYTYADSKPKQINSGIKDNLWDLPDEKVWELYNRIFKTTYRTPTEEEFNNDIKWQQKKIKPAITRLNNILKENDFEDSDRQVFKEAIDNLEIMSETQSKEDFRDAYSIFNYAKWNFLAEDAADIFRDSVTEDELEAISYIYQRIGIERKFFVTKNGVEIDWTNALIDKLERHLKHGIYQLYGKSENPYEIDAAGANWDKIKASEDMIKAGYSEYVRTRDISEYARLNGYDSVRILNVKDSGGKTEGVHYPTNVRIYFNSHQLKSADTITYDDAGNIIPLSERFNSEDEDLRKSIKVDSDGRSLSKDQQEYFKDSKVVDEEGRLRVVYHGTMAEFNIFDLKEARDTEDIEAFFFSGDYEESSGYGNVGEYYLNITNPADYDTAYDIFFKHKGKEHAGRLAREELQSMGYDGVIAVDEDSPEYTEYLVFDSNQIKRVDNKKPTESADIRKSIKVDWDNKNTYKLPDRTYEDDIFFLGTDEEIEAAEKQDITAKAYVANIIHSKDFAGLMFKDSVGIDRLLTRSTRKEWDWQLSESRDGEPIGHENYKEENDDITSYDTWPDKTMAALYNEIINELPKSDARIYVIREGIAEDARNSIKVYGEASPYADSINETKVISTMLGSMNNSLSQVDAFNVSNDAYMQIEKNILNKYNTKLEEGELAANVSFAFAYMQQNKLETNYDKMMNYLLNIGDEVIKNSNLKDPETEQLYNSAKDVVKKYTFKLSEADREEIKTAFGGNWKTAFGELQKAGIKLNNDKGVDIDTVFSQLQDEFLQSAGINLEKYDKPSEQILGLLDAMHALEPTAYLWDGANSMDKALTVVADIINDYYSIATGQLASNVVKGTKKGKETVAAAINKEKDKLNQKFREYKANKTDEFNQIVAEKNRIIQEQQNQIRQQNEQMKKWNAELSDKDKQIQQAKVLTEKQMKQTAKLQAREAVESYRQREEKARQIENIKKTGIRLIKWLNNPTDNQHVPAFLQKPLGEFLAAIDFLPKNAKANSKNTLTWQQRMQSLRDTLVKIKDAEAEADGSVEAYFAENMIAKELISMMDDFLGKETWDEFTQSYIITKRAASKVSLLDVKELATLNKIMSALSASINNMNKTYANSVFKEVSKLAKASAKEIDALPEKKDQQKMLGRIFNFLNFDELEPITYFEGLGAGAKSIYQELRDGFNLKTKHVREADAYMDAAKKELGISDKELSTWKNQLHTFKLTEGTVMLNTTQIMSLYKILGRKQGKPHVAVGGIKSADFEYKDGKVMKKHHQAKSVHIMASEAQAIINTLTPEQKAIADKMQQFMANDCAKWGNRVTEKMFGYKKYEEKDYFPLKTDAHSRATTASSDNNVSYYTIKNSSFTKPITPMANNAVVLEDIFDVFTDHVVSMADYDAYVMPIADAMRWFNYSERVITAIAPDELNEQGARVDYIGNMQESIDRVYGDAGLKYFRQFIKDINGDYAGTGGTNELLSSLMSMYKAQAVGANMRVVIQQPTAVVRASDVIEPTYLLQAMASLPKAAEYAKKAQANSEIAYWKAQGYYETYLGQSFKEIITGDVTLKDKFNDWSGYLAGKADDLSWGIMYKAAELKTTKEQPELKGSDFDKAVTKLFEDIVDHTQVVDTIFHKSQYMRNQGAGYKVTSAFMAEPTKTYNMLYRAYRDAKLSGNQSFKVKRLRDVALIFLFEQLLNAIITGGWDVLRDDEKNNYIESFREHFTENAFDNLNPLNLFPLVKEISSALQGYDATSYFTDAIYTTVDSFNAVVKIVQGKSNKTTWGNTYQIAKAASQLTGVPVANVMREFKTIYNLVNDFWGGKDLINSKTTQKKVEKAKETDRLSKVFEAGDLGSIKTEITNTYNNAIADGKEESEAWSATREMLKEQHKIMVEANPDDTAAINNRFKTLLKYTKESDRKGGYKTPSDKEISNWIEKWNKPKE